MAVKITLIFLTIFLMHYLASSFIVQRFSQADTGCFPYDFNFQQESTEFERILFITRLQNEPLANLVQLDIIPEDNMRYNYFLTCVWKNHGFQKQNGSIEFQTVRNAVASAIQQSYPRYDFNFASNTAASMVSDCQNLGGLTHGHKVVQVRNCLLRQLKSFVRV